MILLRRLLSSSRKRKCKGRNEKFSSPGLWNVNQNIRNTLKIKILTIKLYQHCGSIFLRIDSLESYFCSNTLIAHCTTRFGRSKKLSTILNTHVQKFLLSMAWILCVCLSFHGVDALWECWSAWAASEDFLPFYQGAWLSTASSQTSTSHALHPQPEQRLISSQT